MLAVLLVSMICYFWRSSQQSPKRSTWWACFGLVILFFVFFALDVVLDKIEDVHEVCSTSSWCEERTVQRLLTTIKYGRAHVYTIKDVMCSDWFRLTVIGIARSLCSPPSRPFSTLRSLFAIGVLI